MANDLTALISSRAINYLVHFTRASNLNSILEIGLVPRSKIERRVKSFTVNDAMRWDGRSDYNCASISFPNGPMLYRYMQADKGIKWPILILSPKLLSEKEVLFCKHNAADKRISSQGNEILTGIDAFRGMFAEIDGIDLRADQGLKGCDTTDVQAEVLIRGLIEPKYIAGVVFPDQVTSDEFKYKLGTRKVFINGPAGLYGNRTYYRKFGGGR